MHANLTDDALFMLNIADMAVDSTGNYVGFHARLADIAAQYGGSSPQHTDCAKLVAALQAEANRRGITLPAAVL